MIAASEHRRSGWLRHPRGRFWTPAGTVIIQNDIGNQASRTTIVDAVISNLRVAELPVGVLIEPRECGLPRPSVVHVGRIATIDRGQLRDRAGALTPRALARVDRAILVSLGLERFRSSR